MTYRPKAVDLIRHPVITIGPDDTLQMAIDTMIDHCVTCLPVVSRSHHLLGILTQGDILRRTETRLPETRSRRRALLTGSIETARRPCRKVRDVMTSSVISAPTDTSLKLLLALMNAHCIEQVPIVERGALLGLACRVDLLDRAPSSWSIAAFLCPA